MSEMSAWTCHSPTHLVFLSMQGTAFLLVYIWIFQHRLQHEMTKQDCCTSGTSDNTENTEERRNWTGEDTANTHSAGTMTPTAFVSATTMTLVAFLKYKWCTNTDFCQVFPAIACHCLKQNEWWCLNWGSRTVQSYACVLRGKSHLVQGTDCGSLTELPRATECFYLWQMKAKGM